jgi:hypothetical protein
MDPIRLIALNLHAPRCAIAEEPAPSAPHVQQRIAGPKLKGIKRVLELSLGPLLQRVVLLLIEAGRVNLVILVERVKLHVL